MRRKHKDKEKEGCRSGSLARRAGDKTQLLSPSDRVEDLKLTAHWEPAPNVLGITQPSAEPQSLVVVGCIFAQRLIPILMCALCQCQDSSALDCEELIKSAAQAHARNVLRIWQSQIQGPSWRQFVVSPDGAELIDGEH
jgi:hypothetical protein